MEGDDETAVACLSQVFEVEEDIKAKMPIGCMDQTVVVAIKGSSYAAPAPSETQYLLQSLLQSLIERDVRQVQKPQSCRLLFIVVAKNFGMRKIRLAKEVEYCREK